jgi:hypothetical protein
LGVARHANPADLALDADSIGRRGFELDPVFGHNDENDVVERIQEPNVEGFLALAFLRGDAL